MLLATDDANHLGSRLCINKRSAVHQFSAIMRSPILVVTVGAFRPHDNDNNGRATGPAGNPVYLPAPTLATDRFRTSSAAIPGSYASNIGRIDK
jgi:hypothetical protein